MQGSMWGMEDLKRCFGIRKFQGNFKQLEGKRWKTIGFQQNLPGPRVVAHFAMKVPENLQGNPNSRPCGQVQGCGQAQCPLTISPEAFLGLSGAPKSPPHLNVIGPGHQHEKQRKTNQKQQEHLTKNNRKAQEHLSKTPDLLTLSPDLLPSGGTASLFLWGRIKTNFKKASGKPKKANDIKQAVRKPKGTIRTNMIGKPTRKQQEDPGLARTLRKLVASRKNKRAVVSSHRSRRDRGRS